MTATIESQLLTAAVVVAGYLLLPPLYAWLRDKAYEKREAPK